MIINSREINSIDEAFAMLTEDQQAHSKRVAEYCKIAFRKICARDTYVSEDRSAVELQKENTEIAYRAGLYHDIGKIDINGEINPDHSLAGEEIIKGVTAGFEDITYPQRRMIWQGARDHHERMNGLGGPAGKKAGDSSYWGRIVAIADMLDNLALTITDEDPLSEAMKLMKESVDAGFFDLEFWKAFSACRADLNKVFNDELGDDLPIPKTNPWVKRRAGRPMELYYKHIELNGEKLWAAQMRFKEGNQAVLYEDVKPVISKNKLGFKLGEYFCYELCDALKRFEACEMESLKAALMLPKEFYTGASMCKILESVLSDTGIDKSRLVVVIPQSISDKPTATSKKNLEKLEALGIASIGELELDSYIDISSEEFRREDDIVKDQIKLLKKYENEEDPA